MKKFLLIVLGIVLIGAGVYLMKEPFYRFTLLSDPPISLYDSSVSWDNLEPDTHVKMNVDFLFSYFAYDGLSEDSTDKDFNRFYILPDLMLNYNNMFEVAHYMGLEVSDNYELLDRISDESINWWFYEDADWSEEVLGLEIDGYLREMSEGEKWLLEDVLRDIGYSSDIMSEVLVPYVFVEANFANTGMPLLIPFIMFLLGVFEIVFVIILSKKQKAAEAAAAMEFTVMGDYSSSHNAGTSPDYGTGYGQPGTSSKAASAMNASFGSVNGSSMAGNAYKSNTSANSGFVYDPTVSIHKRSDYYDSEASPEFGTFGMKKNNPVQPVNTAQTPSAFPNVNNNQNQSPDFGSYGRTTSDFVDYNSFKNSLNASNTASDGSNNTSGCLNTASDENSLSNQVTLSQPIDLDKNY